MDFTLEPYSKEALQAGEDLFKNPTSFMLGVANLNQLPTTELNEIALAGRSNVGKSSLINALMNRKSLARTYTHPVEHHLRSVLDLLK